jgi:hypothetical protein
VNPSVAELEESNALALAIIAPGIVCHNFTSTTIDTIEYQTIKSFNLHCCY